MVPDTLLREVEHPLSPRKAWKISRYRFEIELIGGELLSILPYNLIGAGAGLLFIIVGAFSLVRRNHDERIENQKLDFLKTFSVISLMELGDKTQLACVVLAAELTS